MRTELDSVVSTPAGIPGSIASFVSSRYPTNDPQLGYRLIAMP